MKIAVCWPTRGDPKAGFIQSLAALLLAPNSQTKVFTRSGRLLDNRNALTQAALDWGADAVLCFDDDMIFPPDTLQRLLAHDKAIVGANYINRHTPDRPTTLRLKPDGLREVVWSSQESPALEPVSDIGLGVALIRSEVFHALGRPWFGFGKAANSDTHLVGEDYMLCERALAKGFQPYVDHALSMEIGHIADTVLTMPRGKDDAHPICPSSGP